MGLVGSGKLAGLGSGGASSPRQLLRLGAQSWRPGSTVAVSAAPRAHPRLRLVGRWARRTAGPQ